MKATTGLRKISNLRKRIRVVQGGQGSSKTFSILLLLINYANGNPSREVFVASSELTKMRLTVIKDFVSIMKMLNIYNENSFLAGTFYRFPNSSFIKFIGLDKEDLGKGLRSDVVFVNEANKVDFETYRELTSRAKQVYLDFNPNSRFWVHDEVVTRPDADFIKLTYKDNEFLSKEEVAEIENYKTKGYDSNGNEINAYWANKWRVYGLGEEGRIDGTIFQNWELGDFNESLPVMYGIDWGFKDPFVLIKVAFDKSSMRCYVKEKIYKSMLSPNEIAQLVKAKIPNKNSLIIADSADPTQIIGLRNEGFNIMPATKEKIVIGIRALQNWQIVITPESTNVINEFHNYIWLDKSGEVPISGFDHSIDPLRYCEKFYRYKNS